MRGAIAVVIVSNPRGSLHVLMMEYLSPVLFSQRR